MMTDNHTDARKALADIAAMRDALEKCEEYFGERADAEYFPSGPVANEEMRLMVEVQSALAETPVEAATAFEARIRADERTILASQILPILDRDRQAFFDTCTIDGDPATMDTDEAGTIAEYDAAIRAMKGEGDE